MLYVNNPIFFLRIEGSGRPEGININTCLCAGVGVGHGLLYSRTERLFDVASRWAENVKYSAFSAQSGRRYHVTSKSRFDLIK